MKEESATRQSYHMVQVAGVSSYFYGRVHPILGTSVVEHGLVLRYHRGSTFQLKWSRNDGAPQRKKNVLGIGHYFLMILVVHPLEAMGFFIRYLVRLIFSKQFEGGPKLRKRGTTEKMWSTSLVARVHVYIRDHHHRHYYPYFRTGARRDA